MRRLKTSLTEILNLHGVQPKRSKINLSMIQKTHFANSTLRYHIHTAYCFSPCGEKDRSPIPVTRSKSTEHLWVYKIYIQRVLEDSPLSSLTLSR
jgi:hypothetical protein